MGHTDHLPGDQQDERADAVPVRHRAPGADSGGGCDIEVALQALAAGAAGPDVMIYWTDRLTAAGPLSVDSRSNITASPSLRVSMPAACTAVMCTNTSLSSVAMNPKPFWALNHFTVPCVIVVIVFLFCCCYY